MSACPFVHRTGKDKGGKQRRFLVDSNMLDKSEQKDSTHRYKRKQGRTRDRQNKADSWCETARERHKEQSCPWNAEQMIDM